MPIESSSKSFSKQYTRTTTTNVVDVVSGNTLFNSKVTTQINSFSGVNVKSRAPSENPEWRQQVKRRDNATTTYVASEDKIELGSGSTYSRIVDKVGNQRTTTIVTCDGVLPCSLTAVSPDPSVRTKAMDKARAKVFKKIAEKQVPFQGGVFLGELRETLHMIRHPADGLAKLILGEQFLSTKAKLKRASLRRRRPLSGKDLKRSIKRAVAETWLENAFGWQPFISDCEGAMKVYNDMLYKVGFTAIRAVGRHEQQVGVSYGSGGSVDGFVEYYTDEHKTQECKVHVYGILRDDPRGTRAKLGITWGQFVPTIWELLPFSFLADYFSNIGDVLSAVSVNLGGVHWLAHTSVNSGVNKLVFTRFRTIAGSGPESAFGSGGHSPVIRRKKEVSRLPTFDMSYPPALKFEFPFSPRKWANMGSLITIAYTGGISAKHGRGRA